MDIIKEDEKIYMDSLITEYHSSREDTTKLNLIGLIVENVWNDAVWTKYNLWVLDYSNKMLKNPKTDKQSFIIAKMQKSGALGNIGYLYDIQGNPKKAIEFYNKGLKIQEELDDKQRIAVSLGNIGYVYKSMGHLKKALTYYNKSLKINESIKDKKGIAYMLNNIGMVFYSQKQYESALSYFQKSLKLERELNDKYSIGNSLNNIAYIFDAKQQYDSVIYYYNLAFKLQESIGNAEGMGVVSNNLGTVYQTLENPEKAIYHYKEAEKYFEGMGSIRVAGVYNSLANYYLKNDEIAKAKEYGLKALEKGKIGNSMIFIGNAAGVLSLAYKADGNFKKSLEYYELQMSMKDSLLNDDTRNAAIKQDLQYQFEKEALADSLSYIEKQKIEDLKHNQEIEKQKTYTYVGAGAFLMMLLLVLFIYKGYNQKKRNNLILKEKNIIITEQKQEVENQHYQLAEQHKEITDSITYAKRIQSAILPSDKLVKEYLDNSFVLYKPKDIVAGDFYWMEAVGKKILFAAADCTGHGVPGAMVSVVCNNGLNRSVREYGLLDPGKILDKTREIIVQEFEKSEEDVKDGMDIALCSLEGKSLKYAGAHNPLWLIRNGELIEIKANKQPIGKFDNTEPYVTHTLELQKEDTFYIFSDGYADQFGGEKGKKFKTANFKKLLLSIQEETMEQQRNLIDEKFESWKGDLEQLDDVCVIGVKI